MRPPAARRALLGAALAALVAGAPGGAPAQPEGARALVERFAARLAAGDARALAAFYHEDGGHRDLSSGERVRGRDELRELYAVRLGAAGRGAERARIESFRQLGEDAAIAQLSLLGTTHASESEGPGPWPPYTVVVLSREDGRWRVAATRAGGNPETGAHSRKAGG